MLFSIAFIGVERISNNGDQKETSYVVASDSSYINSLIQSDIKLDADYNLSDYYPMINEHQKDSLFCWIYSSMKSLESALMVQKNEYYNFSEIALAYMYYEDRLETIGIDENFNIGGNFSTFYQCYQDNGLVLESDFSNDNYDEINSATYKNYSYVNSKATKELNSAIKPYMLCVDSTYSTLDDSAKVKIMKKFIKTYGAMFAGIEGSNVKGLEKGCFYSNGNAINKANVYKFYDVERKTHENPQKLGQNHAITIIGWDDNVYVGPQQYGAFLVMNSWGFEEDSSIRLFYVPYSYSYMLSTCSGFVCDGEAESISIDSASESRFTTDILKGDRDINNIFCYDDEIWVNYKLNVTSLENIEVKISSGNKQYNGIFSITSDNATKTVKIKLNNRAAFYGGYYTISFYNNGVLLGKRGIFIYSGTEINYFKSIEQNDDSYALDNAFLNADNIATINAPSLNHDASNNVFTLEFNRSPISNKTFVLLSDKKSQFQEFSMDVSEVQIVSSGNPYLESAYTQDELIQGLFKPNLINEMGNVFSLQIGNNDGSGLTLSQFDNCLIKFKLIINSSVYEDCEREYIFNLFVSDRKSARSSDLYSIFYNLNGGENNEGNITKYPRYSQVIIGDMIFDPNMTTFELLKPTKVGAVFDGWYLDENFTRHITHIDNSMFGNLTLYAKWVTVDTDYFDIFISLESARNYDKSSKSLSDALIYGDSISIKFEFIRKTPLENKNYSVQYFFLGTEVIENYLNESDTYKIFDLDFPKLKSGNHIFSVKVKVTISGVLEIVEEVYLPVSVAKKPVVFGFDELSKTYNGQIQKPTVVMAQDFYKEDFEKIDKTELFNLTCGAESKNAGVYNFYVSQLKNNNYSFDASSETSKCVFEITKRAISLNWKEYSQIYDGENHLPQYEVLNIVSGDKVNFQITVLEFNHMAQYGVYECVDAGLYKVNILPSSISNSNYTVSDVSDFEFEIKKSKIKIIMRNTTDRIQTKIGKRQTPEFDVVGIYHSIEDLQINIITEAKVATRSGNYSITCSVENDNYDAEVEDATYVLTGYYNVYYQLSNGKVYTERVEEDKDPLGITKEQLGIPKFSKISYSDDYVVTGDDIYVQVEYKNYTGAVYSGIVIAIAVIVGFVIYLKNRGSSVR